MKLAEARARAIAMMRADLARSGVDVAIDDRWTGTNDAAKFLLNGKPARTILRFSGWFAYLGGDWFDGGFALPRIQGEPFCHRSPPSAPFR